MVIFQITVLSAINFICLTVSINVKNKLSGGLKMPNLYVITGPAGVGKSTVSKILAQKLNKSSLIEGDEIYHQIIGGYIPAWKSGNHLQTFWKICINTEQNSAKNADKPYIFDKYANIQKNHCIIYNENV